MFLRFDTGIVKSVHKSPEGFLIVKGTATRTGVFNYRNPDGTLRRELRHPDDVLHPDSLASLAGKPTTLEHPPELVNPHNVEQYSVGAVANKIHVVGDNLIEIVANVHRADAISAIESKAKRDLSCGYTCEVVKEDGIYKGESYDYRQKNIRYNHLAHVERGRAGPQCGLHLDSGDEFAVQVQPLLKRMMTTINLDGVTYSEVPEGFAMIAATRFKELEETRNRLDSLTSELETKSAELETLEETVEDLESERDRERGRGDALEIQLEEAREELLNREREDSRKKKKLSDDLVEDLDLGVDNDPEALTEEEYADYLKKKKKKKADSADSDYSARMDEYNAAIECWEQAEKLQVGFRKEHFDSSLKPPEIRRLVIGKLKPDLDLSKRDDSYILSRFDTLIEVSESNGDFDCEHRDDAVDYPSKLTYAIGLARSSGRKLSSEKINEENRSRVSSNWQQPLSMSKQK